jgi:hypothetical protein
MEFGHITEPARWSRVLGWATLIGVEFGLIGPFGSYAANPFTRMAFWVGLSWFGALILWPSIVLGTARGARRSVPPMFAGSLVMLLGCVPLAIFAAGMCRLFWPVHASGIGSLEWYGSTLMVAGPCVGALLWLDRLRLDRETRALDYGRSGRIAAQPAALPPARLASAFCLQVEDHHVRVHVPGGSALHLATLQDAMTQAGAARGLQVHRSWWVAAHAVTGWQEDGRSVTLTLTNGLRVPVARSRVASVRSAGWLDGASGTLP